MVFPTMATVPVGVYVCLEAPALPTLMLTTTVAVQELPAPVASAGRAVPASAVAPMAAMAFAVDMAPTAPLQLCSLAACPGACDAGGDTGGAACFADGDGGA